MDLLLVSAVALLDKNSRILIGKRPEGTFYARILGIFQGGNFEKGETPEVALKREIMEELGV